MAASTGHRYEKAVHPEFEFISRIIIIISSHLVAHAWVL